MGKTSRFGDLLFKLRTKAKLSMGQIARELGMSTVYYSEVEHSKKKPFTHKKVDYQKLADLLDTDREILEKAAKKERLKMSMSFLSELKPSNQEMMLRLARKLDDDDLTDDQIRKINDVLGRNNDEDDDEQC